MSDGLSAEATTIVATYSARRDAEMAQHRLDEEGIDAVIRADDAGGMHPQLQRPHGVKLVVLGRVAQRARDVLDAAGLLPQQRDPAPSSSASTPAHESEDEIGRRRSADERTKNVVAVVMVIVFVLLTLSLMLFPIM